MQVACGVYKKCNPSSGIDQLQNCLIAAWKDTAKQQKWQEKTVSTTFQSLTEQSDNTEKLSQIISETIKQLTKEDIECFELNFIRQLSKNSNQEAYKSFMAQLQVENNRLLKSREKIDKSSVNPDYILTPKVSCWKNEYLKDIEDFVKNLCQELQNNKPHICLTGMGGIGKSEILKRIYAEFANNTIKEHPFKHLALLHYDDTLSSSIIKDVTGLGDKRADDAWTYMTNLCNNEHTLLLIDDTRKKIESKTPDDSFEKLFALNATVLLASRKQVHK
ncbi:MAG: hypothetical protein FWF66_00580, partial [Candidatus Bathyarchaeota archaeon]|nr:hypothetical protein [Candidatus Termiticorpusculum sp.]